MKAFSAQIYSWGVFLSYKKRISLKIITTAPRTTYQITDIIQFHPEFHFARIGLTQRYLKVIT